jgi:GT2 family glycosyltransferase
MSSTCAIVILNWNGKKFLEQFLPSVLNTSYNHFEVIVADNASTDDSVAYLQHSHPGVRIIQNTDNWGFAKGYNEALKHVDADYYAILNSDVEVSPGWLEPLANLLDSDSSIAACQPRILSYHDKNKFEYAGAAGGWIDKFGYPFCKGRIFDITEEDRGQYNVAEPIFWASGAALFIRHSVFHEMDGFDEFFFAHQEEIDLCWRMQLAGYKIFSCPGSVVYHVGGGTLQKEDPRKTYLNFRNNLIMVSKNLAFPEKITVMPARFLLDSITAWRGLLMGNTGYFIAIIKAQLHFLGWCFFNSKKRWWPVSKKAGVRGRLQKSIVWQFFVRNKKTFSEIVAKT